MRFFGSQGLYIQLKVFYNFFIISLSFWDLPKYHLFIIYLSFIYHLFIDCFWGNHCLLCLMHAFHCFMLLHAQPRSLCEYVYLNSIYDYMHRGVSKSNVLLLFVGTSSYI